MNHPEKKKFNKVPLIVIGVILLLFVIAGAGLGLGYCCYQYLYESTASLTIVADDIYVNDIAVGGMTMTEARQVMTDVEKELAAQVKVDITAGEKSYQLTDEQFPCSFDTDKVFEKIRDYSAQKSFDKQEQRYQITMTTDTSGIGAIVDQIAEEIDTAPVDAKVESFDPGADSMFTYQEEQTGIALDKEDLTKKLNGVFANGGLSGSVEAVMYDVDPAVTVDFLQNNIVKLSSFSTESTNNENNGSVIDPGEVWSFNNCTGDSNLESNGYKEAGVIVDGESTSGIGGGICQASTTIYNAGILCGMTVEERYCHYFKSTYVDAGRDATIDYGNLDLKLSNPFDYPLYMKCWMSGTKLTCEVYGIKSDEFDQIKITTSDPEQKDDSYTVKAWRIYYLGGTQVKKEELPESTYYTK